MRGGSVGPRCTTGGGTGSPGSGAGGGGGSATGVGPAADAAPAAVEGAGFEGVADQGAPGWVNAMMTATAPTPSARMAMATRVKRLRMASVLASRARWSYAISVGQCASEWCGGRRQHFLLVAGYTAEFKFRKALVRCTRSSRNRKAQRADAPTATTGGSPSATRAMTLASPSVSPLPMQKPIACSYPTDRFDGASLAWDGSGGTPTPDLRESTSKGR
jgi:hypothetical protein